MDSIIPTALVSAVSVVNGAIASVKNARDIAKQSSDSAVKDAVSEAYDAVLDLKDRVLELDEENRQLKAKLTQKENFKRNPKFGYYVSSEEPDSPICQKCYEGYGKVAYLSALKQEPGGQRRECIQCNRSVWETQYDAQPEATIGGRNSWMR